MKSKVEIRNNIVNILNECNGTSSGANRIVDYVYAAMKEYASQQAPASTPPVSANDMTAEEFFNHPDGMFTLNFLTKEEQETLYKAIDLFVVGKIRQTMLSAPVSAMEDGCPTQEQIDAAIDKYAFRVPYDGTNNFYDEVALKHFKAGIEWFKSTLTTPTK